VNIHKDEHLTTNLVCNALNGATHTCSGLRKYDEQDHQSPRVKKNASVNLDYDILAVFACENGLVDKSYNRRDVTSAIKKYVKKNDLSLPKKCPNATVLEYMYNWSLESEQWAISAIEQTNTIGTGMQMEQQRTIGELEIEIKPLNEEHQLDFDADWEHHLRAKKFCTADGVETFKQDEQWQKFFEDAFPAPMKV